MPVLASYESLGGYQEICDFLSLGIQPNKSYKTRELHEASLIISREFTRCFEGTVFLLDFLGYIQNDGDLIHTNSELQHLKSCMNDCWEMANLVCRPILKASVDLAAQEIVCNEVLRFNALRSQFCLHSHSLPRRLLPLRNLLVSFGVLYTDDTVSGFFYIKSEAEKWFSSTHVELADSSRYQRSLDELLALRDFQAELGRKAEQQALAYERWRLQEHPLLSQVRIISELDVGAGYDIISFENISSSTHDRFVEVKSVGQDMGFYWSINEVRTARERENQYHLYLVERDANVGPDSPPIVIPNPAAMIFETEKWITTVQCWHIRHS